MTITELFLIAIGLSMDAFAVSVCKGLSICKMNFRAPFTVGIWFGGFQALMPLIGFLLGVRFRHYITAVDHWIAFVLLLLIGVNMIKEAMCEDGDSLDSSISVKKMFPLAIATSIDALAVGITFAFLNVDILTATSFIGVTTFAFSFLGVYIGRFFGMKFKSKAEFAGGAILIILGCKILLEHLEIL